jgi:hypothetical protein
MLIEVERQTQNGCFKVRYHPIGSSEEFSYSLKQFFNELKEIFELVVVNC